MPATLPTGLAERILQRTIEAVTISDAAIRVLWVNDAFTRLTGYSLDEMRGNNFRVLRSGHHDPGFYKHIEACIQRDGVWEGEIWRRRKNGEIFPAMLTITGLRDPDGAITHYVDFFNDLGNFKNHQQRIEYLVNHDALTGLPNRNALQERLENAVSRARRNNTQLALLFVDLDRFKRINDEHGHLFGDHVLREMAERLRQNVREMDTVARLGGDEFIILLEDVTSHDDARVVAGAILAGFDQPLLVNNVPTPISVSVGVSLFPRDATTVEHLINRSDAAMYAAKRAGRNRICFTE
nr:diguanylate cyclase [Natronocella acetinitrilica]